MSQGVIAFLWKKRVYVVPWVFGLVILYPWIRGVVVHIAIRTRGPEYADLSDSGGHPSEGEFRSLVYRLRCISPAPHLIFYNSIPRTGSTYFNAILKNHSLSSRSYHFEKSAELDSPHTDRSEQLELSKTLLKFDSPVVYSRPYYFLDFNSIGAKNPIYISLIRDPIERRYSWFRWKRIYRRNFVMSDERRNQTFDDCVQHGGLECRTTHTMNSLLPFFCGHRMECWKNSSHALISARKHVSKFYTIVGVMDDMDGFLDILEFLFPSFFKKIQDTKLDLMKLKGHKTFRKDIMAANEGEYHPLEYKTKSILRSEMQEEYELFQFIRQRFKLMKLYVTRMKNEQFMCKTT